MTYYADKNFFSATFVCDDHILEIATPRPLEKILASAERFIGVSESQDLARLLYAVTDKINPGDRRPLNFENLMENLIRAPANAENPIRYRLAMAAPFEGPIVPESAPQYRRFVRISDDLPTFAAVTEKGLGVPEDIHVELAFDVAGMELTYTEIPLARPHGATVKRFVAYKPEENNG